MKKPKLSLIRMTYQSQCIGQRTTFNLLLPYGSASQNVSDNKGPYQTLWLLHGMTDDYDTWLRSSVIERLARDYSLAVLMPDGGTSMYRDMAYGPDYYTFIVKELADIVYEIFPLSRKREDNFIAGLSMGGLGALKLGLRNPDRFSAIGSFSGAVDPVALYAAGLRLPIEFSAGERAEMLAGGIDPEKVLYDNQARVKILRSVYGELAPDQLRGTDDDVRHLLKLSAGRGDDLPVYQSCGTEDFLYEQNAGFRDFAKNIGAPVTYEEWGGGHEWDFWNESIRRFMDFLLQKGRLRG